MTNTFSRRFFILPLVRWAPLAMLTMFVLVCMSACASDADGLSESNSTTGHDDITLGQTSSALLSGLPKTTTLGNMSFAVGTDATKNERGVWFDVSRLATGVWSSRGDSLQITVSGELTGSGDVYMRARVDSLVAQPSEVLFFQSGAEKTSARSFTFVMPQVTDGFHLVRIEWMSTSDFTMNDRTLVVRSLPAKPGRDAQMSYVVPAFEKAPTQHPKRGSWQDIPGLGMVMSLRSTMDMQVTFSGELFTYSRRFILRALLDGQPIDPKDITMEHDDRLSQGTRSMTFTARNVQPGAHTVVMQWYTDGMIAVGRRSLTAVASTRIAKEGGMDNRVREEAPVKVSKQEWVTLMDGAVHIGATPGASIVSTVSVEHLIQGKGALHVRMLADDRVMEPADVRLDRASNLHTQSFSFGSRDFKRSGLIGVSLQFRIDADDTIAQVRDISLASSAVRRTGADFAQAQPFQNSLFPRERSVPLLTICLDPMRPDNPPLTETPIVNMVDGADGKENIRDLYAEMSERRFMIAQHTILGCGKPRVYHPPPEHTGTFYWDEGRFDLMRQDALREADQDFNFAQYDVDHDGELEPHELAIQICIPQVKGVSGFARGGTYQLDGQSLVIKRTVDCYIQPNPDERGRTLAVGTMAHELGHLLLTTGDFYGYAPDKMDEMPGPYSLMGSAEPMHLDAYHKMHSGWIGPSLIDMTSWSSGNISLDAISGPSREAVIIYNPTRNNREFFMIENRSREPITNYWNYDRYIEGHQDGASLIFAEGPVLWHIVEKFEDLDPSVAPPVGDPFRWPTRLNEYGWNAGGIQRWGVLTPGKSIDLKWADGTCANMTAEGVSVGATSVVHLKKPTVAQTGCSGGTLP
jgi:M6 family metalloprotease-like protein